MAQSDAVGYESFGMMTYTFDYVSRDARQQLLEATAIARQKSGALAYQTMHDAYVLPSDGRNRAGLCTSAKEFIPTTSFSGGEQRDVDFDTFRREEASAIYLGCLYSVWGHAFLDNLRRLWFLLSDDGKRLMADGARLIYVNHSRSAPGENFWLLLRKLGLPVEHFELVTEVTQFRTIYVPEPSFCYAEGATFSDEHNRMIEGILADVPADNRYEKVYFSRACLRGQQWREYGEYKIERIFHRMGYSIFCPEKLTLDQQLLLLKNCHSFVAAEGSIAHNSIFCKQGTKVIILRKADYVNDYQLAINEMRALDVTYVDIHHSVPPYPNSIMIGPFYLRITHELERFVGRWIFHLPYWMQPAYWWYVVRRVPLVERYISNRRIVRRVERYFGDRNMHSNDAIRCCQL